MKKTIDILTWNVNMGAALPWYCYDKKVNSKDYDKKVISKDKVHTLINENADILVITEFSVVSGWDYFEEKMNESGYVWFISFVTGNNGLLIMIKKDLLASTEKLAKQLWWKKDSLYHNDDIGLLAVTFELKSKKKCTVCGFRMPTISSNNSKDLKTVYDEYGQIFKDKILDIAQQYYNNSDIVIFAGDFNNARYLEDYVGRAQVNYNWQIIKKGFEEKGYTMLDVSIYNDEEKPINTRVKNGLETPIDHIFTKGLVKVNKEKGVKVKKKIEYSDHYILCSTAILE